LGDELGVGCEIECNTTFDEFTEIKTIQIRTGKREPFFR
jgi:hypothetical protein